MSSCSHPLVGIEGCVGVHANNVKYNLSVIFINLEVLSVQLNGITFMSDGSVEEYAIYSVGEDAVDSINVDDYAIAEFYKVSCISHNRPFCPSPWAEGIISMRFERFISFFSHINNIYMKNQNNSFVA